MSKKHSFNKLLSACKQDWVNLNFNEDNFPLEPVADDENEWEVYEHFFDEDIDGFDAPERLKKLGYRLLGGPRRAMKYVAKHLNIQLDHLLVIAGVSWECPGGGWCLPVFCEDDDGRNLCLAWLDCEFDSSSGWLVLRKKQSA